MKALVMKDLFVLLKKTKFFFLFVLVFSALPNLSVNVFAVVYAGMLPYTALAYDERSKWDQLAAMMPYADREIVTSKFLLGYLFIGGTSALTILLQTVLRPLTHSTVTGGETLLAFCAAAILMALTLPFMFHFGVERGRMAFILVIAGVSTVAGTLFSGAGRAALPTGLAVLLPLAAVVGNLIAIPLSVRLYAARHR